MNQRERLTLEKQKGYFLNRPATRVSNVGATPSVPAMSHPLQITSRQNLMLIRVEENTVVTLVIEACLTGLPFTVIMSLPPI